MDGAFASSGGAIVTAGTGTGDSGVVKIHGGPVGGDVTIITGVHTLDMRPILPCRRRAIVATETGPKD